MEYLEGRSLEGADRRRPDPGRRRCALVRQILEAARFAHRHGVIHRDLKPQNVIVDAEGKATVTDFGIARAGVSEITQTGSVMGTAALPLARAGAGPRGRRRLRPLLDRGDPLRGADRAGPVRGRQRRRGGAEAGLAGAAAAERDQPGGLAGARRGRDAGAGEGARRGGSRTPTRSSPRSTRRQRTRPRRWPGRPSSRRCRRWSPRSPEPADGEDEPRRRSERRDRRWLDPARLAVLLGVLVGLVADPRHDAPRSPT